MLIRAVLTFLVLVAGLTVQAQPQRAVLKPGLSWDWQLDEPLDLNRRTRVLALDLEGVSQVDIARLKARDVLTICYVSVGTYENYRDDADQFPQDILGPTLGNWPNERYIDIRRTDVVLPIMIARFQRCKAKGFDAVEPDNMDLYDNDVGFDITRRDQLDYMSALTRAAHNMGLAIGQKNAEELTDTLVDSMDFLMLEHCFQSARCDVAAPYIAAGKAVFDAEYKHRPVDFAAACKQAKRIGISMILKDRALTKDWTPCP